MISSNNEVRVFIRQYENAINNAKDNSSVQNMFSDIETLITSEDESPLKTFNFSNYAEARICFLRNFYMSMLKFSLKNVSADITRCIPGDVLNCFLNFIFMNGNHKDCFLSLAWGINEFRYKHNIHLSIEIMYIFIIVNQRRQLALGENCCVK